MSIQACKFKQIAKYWARSNMVLISQSKTIITKRSIVNCCDNVFLLNNSNVYIHCDMLFCEAYATELAKKAGWWRSKIAKITKGWVTDSELNSALDSVNT